MQEMRDREQAETVDVPAVDLDEAVARLDAAFIRGAVGQDGRDDGMSAGGLELRTDADDRPRRIRGADGGECGKKKNDRRGEESFHGWAENAPAAGLTFVLGTGLSRMRTIAWEMFILQRRNQMELTAAAPFPIHAAVL